MSLIAFPVFLLIGIVIGFINAISGGGGLISTPLFLAFGLSPYSALATSKLVPIGGLLSGTLRYHRAGLLHRNRIFYAIILITGIGAIIAALITLQISATLLKYIIIAATVVMLLVMLFKKDKKETSRQTEEHADSIPSISVLFMLFCVSIYQGSLGLGGGIFLAFVLRQFLHYSYLRGAALMNAVSIIITLASASMFMLNGQVNFTYGIPMLIGSTIGGYLGAHTAIKKGEKLIRYMTVAITLAILIKILFT